MSALPPKGDIGTQSRNVRFAPKADIGSLFDHLVGASEQRWWDRQPERLGGFKVDDEIELGSPLHWQILRLLAFENATDVSAREAMRLDEARTVAHQPVGFRKILLRSERRQFLANRERRHFRPILERHVRLNDEPLRPGAEATKRRLDFTF